jgi:hypothetical protein
MHVHLDDRSERIDSTPLIYNPSAPPPSQDDEKLEELLEVLRAAEFEEKGASC